MGRHRDSWMNLADDWVAPETAYIAGKDAAAKALALDPELAEANTALGKVYTWYDWEFTRGEIALQTRSSVQPQLHGRALGARHAAAGSRTAG